MYVLTAAVRKQQNANKKSKIQKKTPPISRNRTNYRRILPDQHFCLQTYIYGIVNREKAGNKICAKTSKAITFIRNFIIVVGAALDRLPYCIGNMQQVRIAIQLSGRYIQLV